MHAGPLVAKATRDEAPRSPILRSVSVELDGDPPRTAGLREASPGSRRPRPALAMPRASDPSPVAPLVCADGRRGTAAECNSACSPLRMYRRLDRTRAERRRRARYPEAAAEFSNPAPLLRSQSCHPGEADSRPEMSAPGQTSDGAQAWGHTFPQSLSFFVRPARGDCLGDTRVIPLFLSADQTGRGRVRQPAPDPQRARCSCGGVPQVATA